MDDIDMQLEAALRRPGAGSFRCGLQRAGDGRVAARRRFTRARLRRWTLCGAAAAGALVTLLVGAPLESAARMLLPRWRRQLPAGWVRLNRWRWWPVPMAWALLRRRVRMEVSPDPRPGSRPAPRRVVMRTSRCATGMVMPCCLKARQIARFTSERTLFTPACGSAIQKRSSRSMPESLKCISRDTGARIAQHARDAAGRVHQSSQRQLPDRPGS